MSTEAADFTTIGPKRPALTVAFTGYEPPFDVAPIVQRMLDSVPQKYLNGLGEVVLTNSTGLPRKRRRSVTKSRNKKVRVAEARGVYHPAWQGSQAWIEIFVDNALRGWEKSRLLGLGFIREGLLDVLFHEIGHHIHFTSHPEHREKEDVADVWKVRLSRNYNKIRHPWLRAFLYPLRPIIQLLTREWDKDFLRKGMMSRAEFDERNRRSSPQTKHDPAP